MSLYQKYRPKTFESVVEQQFVTQSLRNALLSSKTVGAYLFHGSHGTGKTSVARILAQAFNCLSLTQTGEPCGNCGSCSAFEWGRMMDIIEIDAASNTGVDNIRELIEKSQFQPTEGKYKVYIIDEVHMLSKPAFNALLKTLEEPPAHVKFILATTDIEKVLDTIISRTQRFDFRRISQWGIQQHLAFIAEKEGISAEKEALELLARLSKGGLRDAISLFEQYALNGSLTRSFVEENLSLVGEDFLNDFVRALIDKDTSFAFKALEILATRSIDSGRFFEEILFFLRDRLRASVWTWEFVLYGRIFRTFELAYPKLRYYVDPFMLLEITTLSLVHSEDGSKVPPSIISLWKKELSPQKENISSEIPEKKVPAFSPITKELASFDMIQFMESLKWLWAKAYILSSLKKAQYSIEQGEVIFSVSSEFERWKLDTPDSRNILHQASEACFGGLYTFSFRVSSIKSKLPVNEIQDIF